MLTCGVDVVKLFAAHNITTVQVNTISGKKLFVFDKFFKKIINIDTNTNSNLLRQGEVSIDTN